MIGHQSIIECRKQGSKPTAIFIEFGYVPMPAVYPFQKAESQLAIGSYPVVTIPPDEVGKPQDLRFCVGCRVHLNGKKWDDDLMRFADQLVTAGASHVIGFCPEDGVELLEYKNGNWIAYGEIAE